MHQVNGEGQLERGGFLLLHSLVTRSLVNYDPELQEVNARGGGESIWEICPGSGACVRLRSVPSRLYLQVATDTLTLTASPFIDDGCDLRLHSFPQGKFAFEFHAFPGSYLGFDRFGHPKNPTDCQRSEDIFQCRIGQTAADVQYHLSEPFVDDTPEKTEEPTFHPLPTGDFREKYFRHQCEKRASEFTAHCNALRISYIGYVGVQVLDAHELQISKGNRAVTLEIEGKLGCFGEAYVDRIAIEAAEHTNYLHFPSGEYIIPVFQADGELIGRSLSQLDFRVYRRRRMLIRRFESFASIQLESVIHENALQCSCEQTIQLISPRDHTVQGSILVQFEFVHKDKIES